LEIRTALASLFIAYQKRASAALIFSEELLEIRTALANLIIFYQRRASAALIFSEELFEIRTTSTLDLIFGRGWQMSPKLSSLMVVWTALASLFIAY